MRRYRCGNDLAGLGKADTLTGQPNHPSDLGLISSLVFRLWMLIKGDRRDRRPMRASVRVRRPCLGKQAYWWTLGSHRHYSPTPEPTQPKPVLLNSLERGEHTATVLLRNYLRQR
jgi:hypothetical protein